MSPEEGDFAVDFLMSPYLQFARRGGSPRSKLVEGYG